MLPEKRRAGRAIRKARRELNEAIAAADIDQIMEMLGGVGRLLAEAFEGFGRAFVAFGEGFRAAMEASATPQPPSLVALPSADPETGDPSQSGVEGRRSHLRAVEDDDPFEGIGDY